MTASQREHQQIDAWLASPGNKPLELVKEARSRLRILERQIALAQREAPAAHRRYLALAQIATLAAKLHETVEFQFEVRVLVPPRARCGVAVSPATGEFHLTPLNGLAAASPDSGAGL